MPRHFPNLIGWSVCFEMADESFTRIALEDMTDIYEMVLDGLGEMAGDITLTDALSMLHEPIEAWELDEDIVWWVRAHRMLPVVRIN